MLRSRELMCVILTAHECTASSVGSHLRTTHDVYDILFYDIGTVVGTVLRAWHRHKACSCKQCICLHSSQIGLVQRSETTIATVRVKPAQIQPVLLTAVLLLLSTTPGREMRLSCNLINMYAELVNVCNGSQSQITTRQS